MIDLPDFLPPARDLALRAGRVVMELLKSPLVEARKADHSLVTNADHAANDLICRGIREAFPDHGILSEETGWDGPRDASFVWLVDPLDGTRAYARGKPGFCVMLGLLMENRPVLGIVYDPTEDRLYEAAKGAGAFQTRGGVREKLRVSGRTTLSEMPVVTSAGFPERLMTVLKSELPGPWLAPINSVGVKVGLLARGEGDIYINQHAVHLWDSAGPQAILEEAGGRMTLWNGSPLEHDPTGRLVHPGPLLATNGPRHQDVIAILAVHGLKNEGNSTI